MNTGGKSPSVAANVYRPGVVATPSANFSGVRSQAAANTRMPGAKTMYSSARSRSRGRAGSGRRFEKQRRKMIVGPLSNRALLVIPSPTLGLTAPARPDDSVESLKAVWEVIEAVVDRFGPFNRGDMWRAFVEDNAHRIEGSELDTSETDAVFDVAEIPRAATRIWQHDFHAWGGRSGDSAETSSRLYVVGRYGLQSHTGVWEADPDEAYEDAAYRYSRLRGDGMAPVRRLFADPIFTTSLMMQGGIALSIPERVFPKPPIIVYVSAVRFQERYYSRLVFQEYDGSPVVTHSLSFDNELGTLGKKALGPMLDRQEAQKPDGVHPFVHSFSLQSPHIMEQVSVRTLLDRWEERAIRAHEEGNTPTVFLDMDGSYLDARWWSREAIFEGWVDRNIDDEKVGEATKKALRMVIAFEKEHGRYYGWNIRKNLMRAGVDDEEVLKSADAYHRSVFFDPIKRLQWSIPIDGMVALLKALEIRLRRRGIPLKKVVFSLRADDDNLLKNGLSSTELSIRAAGGYDGNWEFVFHTGDAIDYSHGASKEPLKDLAVKPYMEANPDLEVLFLMENSPHHSNAIRLLPGLEDMDVISPEGDIPPGTTLLGHGSYTTDPDAVTRELKAIGEYVEIDFDRVPVSFPKQSAGTLMERLKAIHASDALPEIHVDIDALLDPNGSVLTLSGGDGEVIDLGEGDEQERMKAAIRFLYDLRSFGVGIYYYSKDWSGFSDDDIRDNGFPYHPAYGISAEPLPAGSQMPKDRENSLGVLGSR